MTEEKNKTGTQPKPHIKKKNKTQHLQDAGCGEQFLNITPNIQSMKKLINWLIKIKIILLCANLC